MTLLIIVLYYTQKNEDMLVSNCIYQFLMQTLAWGWNPVRFFSWQEQGSVSKLNTACLNDNVHLFVVTDRNDLTADRNTGFARVLW
jgi:hypothetical protein